MTMTMTNTRAGVQPSCPFQYKVLELVSKLVVFFLSLHIKAQHQQADDFGIWGAHAEGVICGKIGKYVE